MAGGFYNPASTRVKEETSGLDVPGVVCLVFPDGTVTKLGKGVVSIAVAAPTPTGTLTPEHVSGTQDGVNNIFTIDGTLTWTVVILYRNGIKVAQTDYSAGGTGNRTLTLTMTSLPDGTGPQGDELLEVVGIAS